MGLFIAMETFKSLPLAEVRQVINQPQDRSTIYKIGSVNLTISVQMLQHVFPIVHSVIQNLEKIDKDERC